MKTSKKIFILGGDGFCGWPTSLHLSKHSHEVTIIDNLSRRKIDKQFKTNSLTPIKSINQRIKVWNNLNKHKINFINIDLSKNDFKFLELIKKYKPDIIIHFAEQRSAPFSMKNKNTRAYTVNNNISVTHNILNAIVESKLDIHLIHLGTMGVYGYGNGLIPEGYINISDIKYGFKKKEIIYPTDPGSIYHMTKSLDQVLFYYYNKNYRLKITDLHQGIVWGTETKETKQHPSLINRFDYDGDYGTVLNRFIAQSAINYPLTVYGSGNQTRAFINIQNTVESIRLAVNNPPKNNKVRIINQITETFSIKFLANEISKISGVKIKIIKNPRKEKPKNTLKVENKTLLNKGLSPIKFSTILSEEINSIAKKYKSRIKKDIILPTSKW